MNNIHICPIHGAVCLDRPSKVIHFFSVNKEILTPWCEVSSNIALACRLSLFLGVSSYIDRTIGI